MFEEFPKDPKIVEKHISEFSRGLGAFAPELDPEAIHSWEDEDPLLQETYCNFVAASEAYANCVCKFDVLQNESKDFLALIEEQKNAHTRVDETFSKFLTFAHKYHHLNDIQLEKLTHSKTGPIALYSAFVGAYTEQKKKNSKTT